MIRLDPFYPIVPDTDWLGRLVGQGAKLIQLRIKDTDQATIRKEIETALKICAAHRCQLVVNDYWREAIETGADFVHLGQEDLAAADLAAIKSAGIRLGISTHSVEELATALASDPDYVALGPVYATSLKTMPWPPQGLPRVTEWKSKISCPLVAIGGITLGRAPIVLAAGADCVAVITDIMTAQDPELHTRNWLRATAPWRDLSTPGPQG